jgi:hypothetical protein
VPILHPGLGGFTQGSRTMTSDAPSRVDPEPIDAEFEPAGGRHEASQTVHKRPPPRLRSHAVTLPELVIGCAVAALLGAVVAIAFTGANSGSATGTLAREIDALTKGQAELAARADQAGGDLVAIRSRLDSQSGRLAQREAGEVALRAELSTLASQISALAGAGSPAPAHAGAANTALGVLLARIDRLEQALADDAAAPKTTRQTQRSITELADKITALERANAELAAALDTREAAVDALEAELARAVSGLDLARGRAGDAAAPKPAEPGMRMTSVTSAPRRPAQTAPAFTSRPEPRAAGAFEALATAAANGQPFVSQHQVLSGLMPSDLDVAALRDIARNGAPTLGKLKSDLSGASQALAIMSGPETGDGWNWLRRATPDAALKPGRDGGPGPVALIMQARQAAELDDARGAAGALDGMTGVWAKAFHPMRDGAMRRADLDARLKALDTRIRSGGAG